MDSPAFCPSGIVRDSLNPQASSMATHPPSHGLKIESVSPIKPKEKIRPICPLAQSGKSVYFCGTNPIEGVRAPQGERSVPLGEYPEGISPLGDSLVTFSSGRKSPGVEGRSALPSEGVGAVLPHGECRGGHRPLASVSRNFFSKTFSKVARLRATFPLQRGKGERSCFE